MNDLLQKYYDFLRLVDSKASYELENGAKIEFIYKKENFAHLLGLHKLKDIQLIQFWQDRNNPTVKLSSVLKRIEKEKLTDEMIRGSVLFDKVETRYDNFSFDSLTTLSYTDAIINFDKTIFDSKLKSDYILFEKRQNGYNHMGVATDYSGNRYIESFFYEETGLYLYKQKIVKVKSFKLVDENGKIIVKDQF